MTVRPQSLSAGGVALPPWPLATGEEVLEGTPERRGRKLWESLDGRVSAGVWECDPGRLEIVIEGDELLVVLDGRLVIQTGQGETLELDRGDVALLPGGVSCVLTVRERCRCAFQAVS